MKRDRYNWRETLNFVLAGLFLLCVLFCPALAADEQEVRVGFFAFDGYHMVDEDGNRSGYGYDLLQQMVGYTNWHYDYVGYEKSWSQMQNMLENGEIDLLTSAQKTENRMERFDFSDEPVGTSSAILTVKAGNQTYMLRDYVNWSGMRVGLLEGNSRNDDFARFAAAKGFTYAPVYFTSTSELVEALQAEDRIDAAVTSNLRAVENESILAKFSPSPFYIMVKKGNDSLLGQINEALELLYSDHTDFQSELMEKYYTPDSGEGIAFTAEERQFIKEMQDTTFTAFLNPDRVPLSYFKNGQVTGIIGDISAEIIRRTGLPIKIEKLGSRDEYLARLGSEEADICLDFLHDYSTAEKYGYHLSTPYISVSLSKLYLKNNTSRNRAGLVTGSHIIANFEKSIRQSYDEVIFYATTDDLVAAIEHGKCDAGFLYTRVCERLVLEDVYNRLTSELVYGSNLSFCVATKAGTDPRLFSILDKAVTSLGDDFVNSIVQKHMNYDGASTSLVGFIYDNPFVFIAFVVAFFVLLILSALILFLFRNRKLAADRLAKEKADNALLSGALSAAKVASEAKSSFLSNMSHEMRTPLNAVIGFMDLARDATPEQCRVYRENALAAAKHLLSIINDVLDMSAINMGKLKIASDLFDFKQMIRNITNIYAPQCAGKGVEFQVILETPVDEWLIGDALRLNQILMNLLGNAIKFTNHGFVRLSICQHDVDHDKIFLRFVISDSGCGMNEDMLSRIGQPFEQENVEITRKYGGSGLGLSIVKTLISLMEGAFHVESAEGVGSTFTIDLPFTRSEQETDGRIPNEVNDFHVLAVDDQPLDCEYLSAVLSHISVRHSCVNSGKDALTELDRASRAGDVYNICLVDWKMPDMDGIELTRRIREKYSKDMTVIVISAYEYQQNTDRAKKAGADLFVSKPLLQSSLLDLFMTITNGRAVKQQPVMKQYDFSGRRVLLAEDNAMNRMVAQALIKKLGIICETANDGKIALDMFSASASGWYDAILMDIQMPNMDGYAATKAIRGSRHSEAKSIPIIALSANAFTEDVAKSLSAGMDEHVTKPINLEILAATLEHSFEKNRK